MTGKHENEHGRCPLCGGRLRPNQRAIVPFILGESVAIIKNVPAEVCVNCHEPFVTGEVTDHIIALLQPLQTLETEVSIFSYPNPTMPEAATP